MPSPSYIDSVHQLLTEQFPSTPHLWNYSENNSFPATWLYATPVGVWGKTYSEFPQAVTAKSSIFPLKDCTTASGPTQQCVALGASVTTEGGTPKRLLAGHSYEIYEAMYDVMTSARVLLDFTTLTPPTGRCLDAFRNAITFLSNKPKAERPVIRILYSNPLPNLPPLTAQGFLNDITSQLDPTKQMEIYVTVMSSSFSSWNHAKIVAADGARVLTGGHNMWGPHYLGANPVFDVSMKLTGSGARHAQDYAEGLWQFELWRNSFLGRMLSPQSVTDELVLHMAYTFNESKGRCETKLGTLPPSDLYSSSSAKFPAQPTTSGAKVLSVGRGASTSFPYLLPTLFNWVYPFSEPSDEAMLKLVSLAQSKVRLSLQSMGLGPMSMIAAMNDALFQEFGKAMQRGVEVQLVLSNPGAVAGGLTPLSAPYDGEHSDDINQKMLQTLTGKLDLDLSTAKTLIQQKFKVANFRYSTEATYPNEKPIPNHAKTFIVDDAAYYIGSQNQYLSNLNEFGFIIEDATSAAAFVTNYWDPLWSASRVTVKEAYDDELELTAEMEAMQFLLALDEDSRLGLVYNHLKTAYDNETDAAEKAKTEELLNDLVVNGGFVTTFVQVLENLTKVTPKKPDVEATPTAIRFVVNLMSDTELMKAFLAVLDQPSSSITQTNDAINAFLTSKGYDCTAPQVRKAFVEMRKQVLPYWTGTYDTWITLDGGASFTYNHTHPAQDRATMLKARSLATLSDDEKPVVPQMGPKLVIKSETEVEHDGVAIKNFSYNDNVLSWCASDGNPTSANITLGQVTRAALVDSFTGMECFGTVTYPTTGSGDIHGKVSIYGRVSKVAPDQPTSDDKKCYTVLYVVGAFAFAALVALTAYYIKSRARANEYQRVARSKREADERDFPDTDEVEMVTSRGRAQEVGFLVESQVRRRFTSQRDALEELSQFESAMDGGQRTSLMSSATGVRDGVSALDDTTASDLASVAKRQASVAESLGQDISGLFAGIESAVSASAKTQIQDALQSGADIAKDVDSYYEAEESGEPLEDFVPEE